MKPNNGKPKESKKDRKTNTVKESRERKNQRKAAKKEEARLAAMPIGGKCPECGLKIRSNNMLKHRAGYSHIKRVAALKRKRGY